MIQTIDPQVGFNGKPEIIFSGAAPWNRPMPSPTGCHNTGVHHVGLHASNPAVSAEFYRDVLGMEIVGGSSADHPVGATAFLSSRPDEESHEIALFSNPAFAHVAFKVSSLAELRSLYARVAAKNIPIKFAADHSASFAFYFDDPDGNLIEVYWPTGDLSRIQPQMESLDLSQPDELLLRNIAPASANGMPINVEQNQVKYVPAGMGKAYRSPFDEVRFLITGEQTGGAMFMAEVSIAPGGGNPPHIHSREDETFFVQQGTLTVQVGGKTVTASSGDVVCLPKGVVHCFQNNGNVDVTALVIAVPGGLEKFFEEAFYPTAEYPEAPAMTEAFLGRVMAAASKCGLHFPPPPEE
jgi:quercetin dioxygenase-like cupin family protein/catechol 2,3-dioxygenase-like lactoylglutathione lyase family enzyme